MFYHISYFINSRKSLYKIMYEDNDILSKTNDKDKIKYLKLVSLNRYIGIAYQKIKNSI
jgi:hypothetical protein